MKIITSCGLGFHTQALLIRGDDLGGEQRSDTCEIADRVQPYPQSVCGVISVPVGPVESVMEASSGEFA